MPADLRGRFHALWTRAVGPVGIDEAWRALDAGYGGAARHYHDWRHVAALLDGHDAMRPHASFAGPVHDAIDLAIVFHDAIYDPARPDNEARSAALLRTCAGTAADPNLLSRSEAMIRATADHAPQADPAVRLMLDLDLAILGAPRPDYETYAAAIRREYAAVPDPVWRVGRALVLERFLARPHLYQTDLFRERFEAGARANLAAEAAALRAEPDGTGRGA